MPWCAVQIRGLDGGHLRRENGDKKKIPPQHRCMQTSVLPSPTVAGGARCLRRRPSMFVCWMRRCRYSRRPSVSRWVYCLWSYGLSILLHRVWLCVRVCYSTWWVHWPIVWLACRKRAQCVFVSVYELLQCNATVCVKPSSVTVVFNSYGQRSCVWLLPVLYHFGMMLDPIGNTSYSYLRWFLGCDDGSSLSQSQLVAAKFLCSVCSHFDMLLLRAVHTSNILEALSSAVPLL